MKLLVDTNILVYDTVEDSKHHELASNIVDSAKELWIPSIVIHEYIWVMLKLGVSAKFLALKILEYLRDPRIVYSAENPEILSNALKYLEEKQVSTKEINDLIILMIAKHYNLTLATFDRKLKRTALSLGVNVIP